MWSFVKFAIALGAILLIFYLIAREQHRHEIQPGTSEYAAYIQEQITACVRTRLAENLNRSRSELPVLPSRAEVEADCRAAVKDVDKLYPRPQHQ